ncbi:MAG: DUF177 domain-containing protein [Acidobacteriota bacterium]|nr:DUF177 domain-containing protein [Acidobacteriota bacterium]
MCQECGRNKNTAECVCEKKAVDPRWAALKDIKKELE